MHADFERNNINSWRVSAPSIILLHAVFTLSIFLPAEVQGQSSQLSAPSVERRLRIEWGITDVQYRQQVLALTPIGTSYADVRAFILDEWHAEGLKIITEPKWPSQMTLMGGYEIVLQPSFNGYGVNLFLRNEPPHVKITDVNEPFPAHQGRRYIEPCFNHKPVWWKRSLYVSVMYVFDTHAKVIDAFALGGVCIFGEAN